MRPGLPLLPGVFTGWLTTPGLTNVLDLRAGERLNVAGSGDGVWRRLRAGEGEVGRVFGRAGGRDAAAPAIGRESGEGRADQDEHGDGQQYGACRLRGPASPGEVSLRST